ncbi:ATP-binding protein [Bacillus sp. JCM 19041]|uniref:ATP-binding protein n=1 Tax=Bacillus sp. JCM 19041 TaxID=1460637 RepID=UPI0006D2335A
MLKKAGSLLLSNIRKQYSDETLLETYQCQGCEQEVSVYQTVLQIGPNKGYESKEMLGCKCEDLALARMVQARKHELKLKGNKDVFDEFSLVNEDLRHVTLETYAPQTKTQADALALSYRFIRDFNPKQACGILFSGGTGVGKSHLAQAMTKELINKGFSGLFITVPQLLTVIKSSYDRGSKKSEYELLQRLKSIAILVLDDIGSEYKKDDGNGWAVSKLFEVIDARLGKATIYTTNYEGEQLHKEVGDRNFSRLLYQTKLLRIDGPDFRYRKKGGQADGNETGNS